MFVRERVEMDSLFSAEEAGVWGQTLSWNGAV
jgi:hypothetical protein